MHSTLHIHLTFLEPYRLVEWHDKKCRTTNPRYLRGQSFARWHKNENGDSGKPYITGTLLRSAVIKASETLLCLNGWQWNGQRCCNGEFYTDGEKTQPAFLRKRPTSQKSSQDTTCNKKEDACPYCTLLGRFDKAGKNHKDNKHSKDDYDIHFGNLNLVPEDKIPTIKDIASERILNRVDYKTGKAHDYFKIWEVDDENFWTFTGAITIQNVNQETENLLRYSLGFVDKLCGAMCTIKIKNVSSEEIRNNLISKNVNVNGWHGQPMSLHALSRDCLSVSNLKDIAKKAEKIAEAFQSSRKIEKLRTLADVVRAMRLKSPDIIEKLPRGKGNKDHYLWDIKIYDNKPLRDILTELKPANTGDWRAFCEYMGNVLYLQYKKKTGGLPYQYRILGDTEYYPESDKGERMQGSGRSIPVIPQENACEWIIVGRLKAETPFYFGMPQVSDSARDDNQENLKTPYTDNSTEQLSDATQDDNLVVTDQTSFRILLDKKGRYRIPRSLLRGILRRDLRTAFGGSACNVELGGMNPCECKVCTIMRRVPMMDSRSDYTEPPDIRYRIRVNPYTATVDEGALFDMEVGPEGITFPCVLRYRGEWKFPAELWSVIRYWMDGRAWLGGSGSTGKGRFKLADVEVFAWDLKKDFRSYIDEKGRRGEESEITKRAYPKGLIKAVFPIKRTAASNPIGNTSTLCGRRLPMK